MPKKKLRFGKGFSVSIGNKRGQAATMVLAPGESEGGPDNRHRGSDQWLYVVSGTGRAVIAGRSHELAPGTLLLIECGSTHEIRNERPANLRDAQFLCSPGLHEIRGNAAARAELMGPHNDADGGDPPSGNLFCPAEQRHVVSSLPVLSQFGAKAPSARPASIGCRRPPG